MKCECDFHSVKQIEETDTWKSRMQGEEEISIFGACILMVSQGREPLWAPPTQMATLEKPAREEQQKMTVRQMSRHTDSYLGALQLRNYLNMVLLLSCSLIPYSLLPGKISDLC